MSRRRACGDRETSLPFPLCHFSTSIAVQSDRRAAAPICEPIFPSTILFVYYLPLLCVITLAQFIDKKAGKESERPMSSLVK